MRKGGREREHEETEKGDRGIGWELLVNAISYFINCVTCLIFLRKLYKLDAFFLLCYMHNVVVHSISVHHVCKSCLVTNGMHEQKYTNET